MANIKKLAMASQLLANRNITVKKSLFSTNFIYNPTGAKIKVAQKNYDPSDGEALKRMISLGADGMKKGLKSRGMPSPVGIGNMQLNICYTPDFRFLAMQMEQFVDYLYRPATDVLIVEGDDAQAILSLMKL